MNANNDALVPAISSAEDRRTPSKPVPTPVPLEDLIAHYNSQLPDYLAAVGDTEVDPLLRSPIVVGDPSVTKPQVIDLIRKQNFRLKRFIRRRSIELLMTVVGTNEEGRTYGHSYADILDILRVEFPEGSTSAAALRWYVVHLWSEADEEGLPRPIMPQIRPRSVKKKPDAAQDA